jgi:2-polyprenyl-3-methyl-5-hydroxy-6-metoxy-1,4-benzoquinol methylase
LESFLAGELEQGIDASRALADDWRSRPRHSASDVAAFYRETPWYAYNLTLWQASGRRPKYVQQALPFLRQLRCRAIIDFGAGVGNDSLALAELGFNITAVDFDNLSSKFLRYRAERRGLDNLTFADIDHSQLATLQGDTLWAMDVVEHLVDPVATLTPVLARTRVFISDSEYTGVSAGRQDFHFQHDMADLGRAWAGLGYHAIEVPSTASTMSVLVRD